MREVNKLKEFYGRSNFFGFMIGGSVGRKVISNSYKKGKIVSFRIEIVYLIIIGVSLLRLTIILGFGILISLVYLPLLIVVAHFSFQLLLTPCLGFVPSYGKQLKQWHATEHKVIYVLENGQELTLKSLREAPLRHYKCGHRNWCLEEPSREKLIEALRVGKEYLNLIN